MKKLLKYLLGLGWVPTRGLVRLNPVPFLQKSGLVTKMVPLILALVFLVFSSGLPLYIHICVHHAHQSVSLYVSDGCGEDPGPESCCSGCGTHSCCDSSHQKPPQAPQTKLITTCCEEFFEFIHIDAPFASREPFSLAIHSDFDNPWLSGLEIRQEPGWQTHLVCHSPQEEIPPPLSLTILHCSFLI